MLPVHGVLGLFIFLFFIVCEIDCYVFEQLNGLDVCILANMFIGFLADSWMSGSMSLSCLIEDKAT